MICLVLLPIHLYLPTAVGASDFEQAVESEAQAHDAYYRGLVKLGRNATAVQKSQLWRNTLRPAKADYGKASSELISKSRNTILRDVASFYKTELNDEVPSWLAHLASVAGVSSSRLPSASRDSLFAATQTPGALPAPTSETEPALDVSTVEREFSFPGPKGKNLPGSRAKPSPSPVRPPEFSELKGEPGEEVQSFSFTGRPSPSPNPKATQAR